MEVYVKSPTRGSSDQLEGSRNETNSLLMTQVRQWQWGAQNRAGILLPWQLALAPHCATQSSTCGRVRVNVGLFARMRIWNIICGDSQVA